MAEATVKTKQKSESGMSRDLALWAGILAGPVAVALDEGISYSITQNACSTGNHVFLHLLTFLALCLIAAGAISAWSIFVRVPPTADQTGGAEWDRTRFMAILGLVLCALFTLIVIAEAVPRFILGPCD
jgi:hypothetical protein